jgi:hypothetical protein
MRETDDAVNVLRRDQGSAAAGIPVLDRPSPARYPLRRRERVEVGLRHQARVGSLPRLDVDVRDLRDVLDLGSPYQHTPIFGRRQSRPRRKRNPARAMKRLAARGCPFP